MRHALANKMSVMLAPASQTNSATRTANLDTLGADYATIVINMASAINTNAVGPTLQLSESDDTVVTNFATFNSNFNTTSTSIVNARQIVYHVDTKSRKRYLRLSLTTATATNDNVTAGVTAMLSRVALPAVAASSNLGSTNDSVVVG
jgi:hypothetical protein